MRILVVNAGSSSLKLSILDERERLVTSHEVKASETSRQEDVLRELIESHGPIDAVGHRVVHGGSEFTEAVIVDDAVLRRLEALTDLAPLHQPESLEAFALASRLLPDVPAVACFDTAFHARMPLAASTYALPADWRQRWGLRRFGFHGLAHAYTSRRAAQLMGTRAETGRVVTCHLGSGASIAAVQR
ncbi:MAG: acetate/propionate family kinase, partial [Acidimicrobiales bacterium]